MTVKLALLKSGEDIVADIQEMFVEERLVGYIFNRPCGVKLYGYRSSEETSPMRIELTPWLPLTNDEKIPVSLDWVVTIVEPMDKLKQMYISGVIEKNGNKDSSTNE